MDELVTVEETDGGSDILLVVPKATVLQVRAEQQQQVTSVLGKEVGGQHCTGLHPTSTHSFS